MSMCALFIEHLFDSLQISFLLSRTTVLKMYDHFDLVRCCAANSHSAHLIEYLDTFIEEKGPEQFEFYLVMEFCHNGSLREMRKSKVKQSNVSKVSALGISASIGSSFSKSTITRKSSSGATMDNGSLSDANVIRYAIQIAKGIKELHERRLVHCDLKTENIMVTTQSNALLKIGDFGRIQQLDNLTQKGPTGSLAYMAPRQ